MEKRQLVFGLQTLAQSRMNLEIRPPRNFGDAPAPGRAKRKDPPSSAGEGRDCSPAPAEEVYFYSPPSVLFPTFFFEGKEAASRKEGPRGSPEGAGRGEGGALAARFLRPALDFSTQVF